MSRFFIPSRILLHGSQIVAGLGVGLAIGLVASQARAADTVASLIADPKRLAVVQQGCKTNQPWATDTLCRTAADARRRRFRGEGVPYTPRRIDPYPLPPKSKPAPIAPDAKRTPQKVTAVPPSSDTL